MGMYTELYLGVSFKKETPVDVINMLTNMMDPEHVRFEPLAGKDRLRWALRSAGSAYFDAQPHCELKYVDYLDTWYLTMVTNIKNYESEWQILLNYLEPWINTQGHIGHLRYEEDEFPTILMMIEGKIKWVNRG